jgi:hypothetical protein
MDRRKKEGKDNDQGMHEERGRRRKGRGRKERSTQ